MCPYSLWTLRLQVGGTDLTTKGSTVAILAQGTSWAVATTQAFWAAVQFHLAGLKVSKCSRTVPAHSRFLGEGIFGVPFFEN